MALDGRHAIGTVNKGGDMKAELDQRGFWVWFAVYFVVSAALIGLWYALAKAWPDNRPLLVIVPIRLLLLAPQLSIYRRRLREARRSAGWIFCLAALYAVGLAALLHYQHRLDTVGATLKLVRLRAADESSDNVEAIYENDLETVLIVGAGALTGFPGPLQLIFAVWVGRLKSRITP